ncbi:MAG: dihydroorotate dehydrogenase electron transfer subunit [Candidatus Eisenbacteria bacterium]|uniref:Dihydroorotate dehydrogenase electron transfer subunit n=1 Tax=Eiseniibacteriota bacterium TaxID=2212470 RepID=A0A538TVT2_UNCEI|nr:MAG: dihydroorotate dehydrogenase electron transfer subunit [Candidatus Eisenbacteria bacterium]
MSALALQENAARALAWRQVTARVARHQDYGAGHRWLDLVLPAVAPRPLAGQFVQLLLEAPSPVLLPRPMSVAAAATRGDRLVLGFLYAPVGSGTRTLAALEPGDHVEVLSPLGRGYPLEIKGTPVLVAGGRGVAPLLFAADALARSGRRCEFFFGARDRGRLVGLEEARRRLDRMGSRLHLATDDGSRGFHGTVMDLLDRVALRLPQPLVIHACGPHSMLKAVARWGTGHGVPAYVAMESIMACGTGVCRGCPLPRSSQARAAYGRSGDGVPPSLLGNRDYAMCCTEGPVFAAEDLDWERVE